MPGKQTKRSLFSASFGVSNEEEASVFSPQQERNSIRGSNAWVQNRENNRFLSTGKSSG